MNAIIVAAYERLTGRPYYTVGGHAARDFGPTPGAEIAAVFGPISNRAALDQGAAMLAQARRIRHQRKAVR